MMFDLIAALAKHDGIAPLNQHDGCWVRRLDTEWVIAVNGHSTSLSCEPPDCMAAMIAPYEAAVWFNGWLAGMFGVYGGFVAVGNVANKETLTAALRAALAQEHGG